MNETQYKQLTARILTDSWPSLELSELDLESEAKESQLACFDRLVSQLSNSALPFLSILYTCRNWLPKKF